jgi:hypothetical protein
MPICSEVVPVLREYEKDHLVACHLYDKDYNQDAALKVCEPEIPKGVIQ